MTRAMTVEALAEALRVSEYTVRRWCRDGVIPARKVGRRWYVLREAYGGIGPSGDWSNRSQAMRRAGLS